MVRRPQLVPWIEELLDVPKLALDGKTYNRTDGRFPDEARALAGS